MQFPLLAAIKIALGERDLTTCCYKEVATPSAVYWEVLNGGWIGSGYIREDMIGADSDDPFYRTTTKRHRELICGIPEGIYVDPAGRFIAYAPYDAMTHMHSARCYKRYTTTTTEEVRPPAGTDEVFVDNYHFEPETCAWLRPHAAQQFSS